MNSVIDYRLNEGEQEINSGQLYSYTTSDLTRIQDTVDRINLSHGWREGFEMIAQLETEGKITLMEHERLRKALVAEKLALISSEVAEAVEALRDDLPDSFYRKADGSVSLKDKMDGTRLAKPDGLATEIADVVIRSLDLLSILGYQAAPLINEKLAFNEQRAHRHGGRAL